jgi:uncharacterized protein
MPEEAFKDLKPWAVVTLLSSPPSETGEFLDMLLFTGRSRTASGSRASKPWPSSSPSSTLSETDQIALLRETLASREQLPRIFEALIAAYLDRDLDELADLSDSTSPTATPVLPHSFKRWSSTRATTAWSSAWRPCCRGRLVHRDRRLHLPGDQGRRRAAASTRSTR